MAMSRCSYCGSVQGATNSRGDWVCYACGKTTLANFSGKAGAADAITCTCPHCGTAFRVGASLQGKSVRCKKCGAGFVVSASPATFPSAADLPPTIAVSLPNRQAAGGAAGVPPAVPPSPAVSPGPVAAPGSYPAGGASLPPVMPPPPPIPTHESRLAHHYRGCGRKRFSVGRAGRHHYDFHSDAPAWPFFCRGADWRAAGIKPTGSGPAKSKSGAKQATSSAGQATR
jgi:predicted Zn finger-like uncharacterized protein